MNRPCARGFSLVELLVVVGIIVVLVAILVPSLESAMAASQRSKCATNLSAIGKGMYAYISDSPTNMYPQTTKYYMLLGQLGNSAGYNDPNLHDSDKRPLNKYLSITGKGAQANVAQCPSDVGGQFVLDPNNDRNFTNDNGGVDNGTSNVFNATGSSYVDAFGYFTAPPAHLARTGIGYVFGTAPFQVTQAQPPASKVLLGDAPLHGENKYASYGSVVGDRRNRWHGTRQRQFNILFADYHVEFFNFGDPSEAGPDNIENTDGNGTPIASTSAAPRPSRGFW